MSLLPVPQAVADLTLLQGLQGREITLFTLTSCNFVCNGALALGMGFLQRAGHGGSSDQIPHGGFPALEALR